MPHSSDFMDPSYLPPYEVAINAFGLNGHAVYTPKPLALDTWILTQLRRDAREWWYHKQLRQLGKVVEATRYERRAIRENVRLLRRIQEEGVEQVSVRDGQVSFVQFHRKPFADGNGSEQTSTTVNHPGLTRIVTELHFRYQWKEVK